MKESLRVSLEDPQWIGVKSKEFEEEIPLSRMKELGEIMYGSSSFGSEGVQASSAFYPTLLTRFRLGEFELIERLGLELRQILHAEQAYEYYSSFLADQKIWYQTEIHKIIKKEGKGGVLYFIHFLTLIAFKEGRSKIAQAVSTMAYRGNG